MFHVKHGALYNFVPPRGIEPRSQASEACGLSVELWRQDRLPIVSRETIGSRSLWMVCEYVEAE